MYVYIYIYTWFHFRTPNREDQSSKTLLLRLCKTFNVERIQRILPEQRASTRAPSICLNLGNGGPVEALDDGKSTS